jgi:hypothetical protein
MLMGLAGKSALGAAVVGLVAAGVVGVRSLPAERDDSRLNLPPEATAVVNEPAATVQPVAAPAPQKSAKAPEQNASSGELREEILLLDQVRTALQHGSGAAALEQLDRYRQRFPSGILSREAALLRQQAAARRGPGTAR